jgi:Fe-S-cluster containining protein
VVPVSQPEARQIHDLLENLPPARRDELQRRFASARERLASTDLPDRMARAEQLEDAERQQLAVDYFKLGVACPFLEDESCSIYADRPLVCREYLVTTPAENCAQPMAAPVVRVKIAGRPSVAMGQLEPTSGERGVWWMPLVLAPDWAEAHPTPPDPQPAMELLRAMVGWLTRTS